LPDLIFAKTPHRVVGDLKEEGMALRQLSGRLHDLQAKFAQDKSTNELQTEASFRERKRSDVDAKCNSLASFSVDHVVSPNADPLDHLYFKWGLAHGTS
jgi:hypothetical protein